MSNTSFARDTIIRRAFALIEDAAGDATRRARHAPAGRRARNTERARPLARSLARAPTRVARVRREPRARGRLARAIAQLTRFPTDARAVGRIQQIGPTPIFASELSRPVRHVGLSPTRWRHSTSRADPNPRDVPPDAEPPPLDDASRRARAPSRRAPHRLGQSQAAQEQRGPIDRPRRDGDRDRDSVCVSPRVHRRRRRRPRRVHSRCRRRRTLPTVTREAVLDSCYGTTFWMLAIGVTAREATRFARDALPSAISDWTADLPLVAGLHPPSDPKISRPTSPSPSPPPPPSPPHAPRFSARGPIRASGGSIQPTGAHPAQQRRRRHGQFPPGRRGGGAFRGALLPALGCGPVGVAATGAAFGALHVGGGRNWAFAGWAAGVGCLYGAAAVQTGDVAVAMLAHGLANYASAAMWLEGDKGE